MYNNFKSIIKYTNYHHNYYIKKSVKKYVPEMFIGNIKPVSARLLVTIR